MGGSVPFSSKGCATCRKRKVKCDLQKPECGGCIKRRMICPGYIQGHHFFAHYGTTRGSEKSKNGPKAEVQMIKRAQLLPRKIEGHSQIRMQLHASFMDSYYPPSLDMKAIREVDLFFQLMSSFIHLPERTVMLETAISALSCLYFGAANHDQRLLRQGTRLYNNTIHFMTSRIRKSPVTDDIIYTSVIFKAIETFNCPGGTKSMGAHMDGHNTFLRQLDHPKQDTLMKHVFKLQKQGLMYAPMLFKSFGSDFDYLKQYNDDSPFDELFEIYVEITSLAAAANLINKLDQDCERLLWSCRSHQKKALEWYYWNLEGIGGRPISCSIDQLKHIKVPLPPAKQLFGLFYKFGSLRQAELHVFFWKAMIIIQLLIYRAQVLALHCSRPDLQHASIESIPTDPRAYDECMLAGEYADEMCRAIPYFLQDGMGSYGMLKITVNLPYILKSYTHLRCREKFLWIQKTCQSVTSDGNDLALCHSQVWWKYWFLCEDPTINYIRSLAFNEDYTERYHVSIEGDFAKVIKVTKDGESSVAPEVLDMPAGRQVLDVSDTREPLEPPQILS